MSENSQASPTSSTPHRSPKPLRWWLARLGNVSLFFAAGVLLIFLLGVAQKTGWIEPGQLTDPEAPGSESGAVNTCPMHPQIRQADPGRCPICGMALVPATASGSSLDHRAVRIEPAQRRLSNIETAEVTARPVSTSIRTIGSIEIDESRQATIAAYIDGRVERLFADYTGVVVDQGDHLAIVYSPQLYSAQVEYLQAQSTLDKTRGSTLESVRQAQRQLAENARQRLVELGMTEEQLAELESSGKPKSRLTIYTPIGGTVIERLAEEGKYLSAGEPIYRIANLSTVWLMLELYPEDASRIRFGQRVEAELTSLPGRTLTGRVGFIDPRVDKANRTVGVRVEFDNRDGELRPGDYAQARIEIPINPGGEVYDAELAGKWISPMHPQIIEEEPGDCPICGMKLVPTTRYGYSNQPVQRQPSIMIPRSALLLAGENSVVYVETEPGRFELRNVGLGPILRDEVVILEGVTVGEKVATSGNFLIDSQMQLAGKPSLIDPTRAKTKPEFRNTPLTFEEIDVARVGGETGRQMESLYQAYFAIQRSLAADESPSGESVLKVEQLSQELLSEKPRPEDAEPPRDGAKPLPAVVLKQLETIKQNIPHLHHLPLDEARVKFKPVSHAIVTLAAKVRGAEASQPFHHFFCPMVKQGEGDWLQPDDMLRNPYWGSQMLECGELVRSISPDSKTDSNNSRGDEPRGSPQRSGETSSGGVE